MIGTECLLVWFYSLILYRMRKRSAFPSTWLPLLIQVSLNSELFQGNNLFKKKKKTNYIIKYYLMKSLDFFPSKFQWKKKLIKEEILLMNFFTLFSHSSQTSAGETLWVWISLRDKWCRCRPSFRHPSARRVQYPIWQTQGPRTTQCGHALSSTANHQSILARTG